MALRALLIDFGHTLARERSSRAALYAAAARARGLAVDEARMAAAMRAAHESLPREIGGAWRYSDAWFERFLERVFLDELALAPAELPGLARELFERFAEPRTFELVPGAAELLDAARARGLVVGLVSNWSPHLAPVLAGLGLAERLDFVLCSAEERLEKPDPALFERALARAGVRADEALHAGDDPEKDLAGARRAGLRAVLVDPEGRHLGAWPRVRGLEELAELVVALS